MDAFFTYLYHWLFSLDLLLIVLTLSSIAVQGMWLRQRRWRLALLPVLLLAVLFIVARLGSVPPQHLYWVSLLFSIINYIRCRYVDSKSAQA